jgi:hypothetical protein
VIQTVVQVPIPVNHPSHLHLAPHPVLLGHQVLLGQPSVLYIYILDTKDGQEAVKEVRQEVAKAVRQVKVHQVKVHQVNQTTEVHQAERADRVARGQPGQTEEVVHQDKLDTIIHQGQLEINIHHDGTKGLNKLKLYAHH